MEPRFFGLEYGSYGIHASNLFLGSQFPLPSLEGNNG